MIRLLLDPPRFECETAIDAFSLAGLFGIGVSVHVNVAAPIVNVPAPIVNAAPTPAEPAPVATASANTAACRLCGQPFTRLTAALYCPTCRPRKPKNARHAPKPSAPPTPCVKPGCKVTFSPERSGIVHCPEHRLGPGQKRASAGKPVPVKPPVPAAGMPTRVPIHPDEPTAPCRTCGDVTRAHELINGECLDCAPLAARKSA